MLITLLFKGIWTLYLLHRSFEATAIYCMTFCNGSLVTILSKVAFITLLFEGIWTPYLVHRSLEATAMHGMTCCYGIFLLWQQRYVYKIGIWRHLRIKSVKSCPNGQTLFGKHFKFCLSSTMFVGLTTTQTHAWQTFFACHKQKIFLKSFKNVDKQNVLIKQCFSWWPNAQACLTRKIRNVCQTMSARLSGALWKTQGSCVVDLATLSNENRSS